MRHTLPTRALLSGCLAAAAMLTAACGADDDNRTRASGDAATATKSAAPKPTGKPIKLMVVTSLSDATAIKEVPAGAKARVEAVNAAGGIKRRPLELIVCDDSNPSVAACARRAVRERVAAVVGSQTAGDGLNPVLERAGIANLGNFPLDGSDYRSSVSFPIQAGLVGAGGLVKLLVQRGSKKVAPVVFAGSPATTMLSGFMEQAARANRAAVTRTVGVPIGAPDVSSFVQKAAGDGAEGMAVAVFPSELPKFLIAAKQTGVEQKIAISSVSPDVLEDLGDAAEGVLVANSFRSLSADHPEIRAYNEQMERYQPDETISDFSLNSWAAVRVFEEVAKRSRSLDAAGVLAALKRPGTIDVGVVPPFDTSKDGPIPQTPRIINPQVFFGEIRNGKVVQLQPDPSPIA